MKYSKPTAQLFFFFLDEDVSHIASLFSRCEAKFYLLLCCRLFTLDLSAEKCWKIKCGDFAVHEKCNLVGRRMCLDGVRQFY